jgi:glutamate/aspartate transport system substrate-binding protein
VTGYTVELCKRVAEKIRSHLGHPEIKVKYVPVDASNRIPLVQNGTIDLECAGTSNTAERQKVVAFSYNTLYADARVAVLKSSGIKTATDLKGKTISVVQGTTQQKELVDLDKKYDLGIKTVLAKDSVNGAMMLESERVDGAFNDPYLLAGIFAKTRIANQYIFVPGTETTLSPMGIMFPKGDERYAALVNEEVKTLMANGTFEEIYNRFFLTEPMHIPMTAALRRQMQNPNASPDPIAQ